MKATSQTTSIKERFDTEKSAVLNNAEQYLLDNQSIPEVPNTQEINDLRNNITKLVGEGKFEDALVTLETLRDAKTGITQKLIKNAQGASTLIRDARSAIIPVVRQTESFEMQYLNAIRAGMDLAEGKPELQEALKSAARKFFAKDGFHTKTGLTQQQLGKEELSQEIRNIGVLLGVNGISQAYTKLNVAKDFQNFKDTHSNIVTLSSVTHAGKTHTTMEAEIAMKGLTFEQQSQYAAIINPNKMIPKPSWFEAMPKWEQELCKKYAPAILKGQHVMPTQLRQMVGMKNAFEKITSIYDPTKSKFEIIHTSKHAGTLTSLARDKDARQNITDLNARQAQEWVGSHNKLHCNTFNSGPIGAGADPEIVRRTTQSMKNVGGKQTNTAFNAFRMASGASNLGGVKNVLNDIAASLPDDPAFKKIKDHIQPKGFVGKLMRSGDSIKEINNLQKTGKIDQKTKEILEKAIDLRQTVEKGDKLIRLGDPENLSLQISTKLNNLSQTIINMSPNQELIGIDKSKLPREEILNMCASGKDRTGLAEHDQSVQAIAAKIGATAKDIDNQLLANGHTAQQAGGIHAGGATIGCYGTKSENRAGLPKSRKVDLENIIEVSANSNKIKGDSKKFDKLIEAEIATQNTKPLAAKRVSFKEPLVQTIPEKSAPTITKQQQNAAKDIGNSIATSVKVPSPLDQAVSVPKTVTIAHHRKQKGSNQIG